MSLKNSNRYVYKIENFPNREMNKRSFSKCHLEFKGVEIHQPNLLLKLVLRIDFNSVELTF